MTNAKVKSYVVGIKPLELTTDGRKLISRCEYAGKLL
jgi:hypothetical protein